MVASLDCQACGSGHMVQAAHTNWGSGKGRGIKAHDYRIAALCYSCHMELDQGTKMTKEERADSWDEAHRGTIGWLFENGHIDLK